MIKQKTILVAPLNWGLGHATRCIPIINALLHNGFKVLLASDGRALQLLTKEFPELPSRELPGYNIVYPKNKRLFKLQLLLQSPSIIKAAAAEKKLVQQWVAQGEIDGIISDNRLGVIHPDVHSVFITHQLQVLSGTTTVFSSRLHKQVINKFNACWIPDWKNNPNLAGKLAHPTKRNKKFNYLGPLSRLNIQPLEKKYDYLVLLSGPEPQRGILEQKLLAAFKTSDYKVLFVLGKTESQQKTITKDNLTIITYLTSKELEVAINQSEFVISRSGYTTIMDLVKLNKKALFIPTPGQYEQQYLAKRLAELGAFPYVSQARFSLQDLQKIPVYKGIQIPQEEFDFKPLFAHF